MELVRFLDMRAECGRASSPTAGRPSLSPSLPPPSTLSLGSRDPSPLSSRHSSEHPRVVSGSAYVSPPARQKLGHPRQKKSLASPEL